LIWEELEQNAGEETRLSASYLTFIVVTMLIASIGVLVDQPILIVGGDGRRAGVDDCRERVKPRRRHGPQRSEDTRR
jgi:hypothetical protein